MKERKTLYLVSDCEEDYNSFKDLVEAEDDIEGEIVGTEDGTIRLFNLAESVYKENGLKPNDKAVFIGKIKSVKEEKKSVQYIFEKYGVKYGFTDNRAFIDIDESVVANKLVYDEFFKEFKELCDSRGNKTKKIRRSTAGKVLLTVFVLPVGIAKMISNRFTDKKAVRKQLHIYGIMLFYLNHLQEFMDRETEMLPEETPNNDKKKNKLDAILQETINNYNCIYSNMKGNGETLHMDRVRSCDLIDNIKNLINSIANHPKEFDTSITEIEIYASAFTQECKFAQQELKAARESAAGALAGGTSGAAIAAVTPAAAMWIATTFGTSSTGTAISTLSGAAATKAALAWLGGGSIAAGGGGVAAGESLLAMAGPIGIGVAAVTILTTVVLFETKKMSINKKRKEMIQYILQNTEIVKESFLKITALLEENEKLYAEIGKYYTDSLPAYGNDYTTLDDSMKLRLGSLVNDTKAMAACIGKTI